MSITTATEPCSPAASNIVSMSAWSLSIGRPNTSTPSTVIAAWA
jgi:hypothetical protein